MGRTKAFDDPQSFLHTLYATIIAYISPTALVAASIIYYAYQKYKREKWREKRGDFIEWLTGILIGTLLRILLPPTPT